MLPVKVTPNLIICSHKVEGYKFGIRLLTKNEDYLPIFKLVYPILIPS